MSFFDSLEQRVPAEREQACSLTETVAHPQHSRAADRQQRDGERPNGAPRGGDAATEGLAQRMAETIRKVTKLRGEAELRAPGSLPNDGKVIDDLRKLD